MTYTRQDWIKDLESGKFRQGRGQMRYRIAGETLHCCLGVAAEQAGCEFRPSNSSFGESVWDPDLDTAWGSRLPQELMNSLDLDDDDVGVLVAMNDEGSNRFTFLDIAQLLRSAEESGNPRLLDRARAMGCDNY